MAPVSTPYSRERQSEQSVAPSERRESKCLGYRLGFIWLLSTLVVLLLYFLFDPETRNPLPQQQQ